MYQTFDPPPEYENLNKTITVKNTSLDYLNAFDIHVIEFSKYSNRMIFTKNIYCSISYFDFVKKIHKSIKYIHKCHSNTTSDIKFIVNETPFDKYKKYKENRDIILIIITDRGFTTDEKIQLNNSAMSHLLHILIFPVNVKICNINKNIIINTDCIKAMEYPYDSEVTKWVKKGLSKICNKQYPKNSGGGGRMCPCFML